jgi:hypothetical protein
MSDTNGTAGGFRQYHCSGCGKFLFESNVPLGTTGQVRLRCDDRRCRRNNALFVGDPPRAAPSHAEWLARRTPRAVSLDRLTLSP